MDINAHFVKLRNLHLSHLNAENAGCSGDVIMINSFSCSDVTIENCDINGCGVVGVNLYATNRNSNLNYYFKNNSIHNNSTAAITINGESYQEEVNKFDGIVFENNKIWNNGSDKINEPFEFMNIFTFGLGDSLQKKITGLCHNVSVYHFDKIENKPLPFYGPDGMQVIGYINPTDFSKGKTKGVLVYERFKPVKFYDKLPKDLCDSGTVNKDEKMVIVYSDPKAEEEYFENGGEDWTWFVEEVWSYYSKQGVTVKKF
ncbi:MAG: right-handed parallel beta-helix repeat-containing protein [Chloroflexia bacterium]|nr:right-handed parallel beta-helix repeat-containing protein [Chloroflexia bacterium]